MKCDRCDEEAVVHEIVVQGGEKVEKHLCSSCASEEGLVPQQSGTLSAPLSKLVLSSSIIAKPASGSPRSCPGCGATWAEFRKTGLLGCPECYETFDEKLTPLLERAHEGSAEHTGKAPRRSGEALDRRRLVAALRKQLLEAVDAEHYERAAELRDKLRSAEEADGGYADGGHGGGTTHGGGHGSGSLA